MKSRVYVYTETVPMKEAKDHLYAAVNAIGAKIKEVLSEEYENGVSMIRVALFGNLDLVECISGLKEE